MHVCLFTCDLSVPFIMLYSELIAERLTLFTSLVYCINNYYIMQCVNHMYVCYFNFHVNNDKVYLPHCTQRCINYECNNQANNIFTLKSILCLLRVEILPWKIIRNIGALLSVPFDVMFWMLIWKPWMRGGFLNNISLGTVLADEGSLCWYFTFSKSSSLAVYALGEIQLNP